MFLQQSFIHHGWSFAIEAENWPTQEAADAAIIELQSWTLLLGSEETATLHGALRLETEALLYDEEYDNDIPPLPAVREAQRRALKTGLQGQRAPRTHPMISIEAAIKR